SRWCSEGSSRRCGRRRRRTERTCTACRSPRGSSRGRRWCCSLSRCRRRSSEEVVTTTSTYALLAPRTSAAPHRVPAVEALVAGAVAHGDVPAGIAEGSIAGELAEQFVLRYPRGTGLGRRGRALEAHRMLQRLRRCGRARRGDRIGGLGAHRCRGGLLGTDVGEIVA